MKWWVFFGGVVLLGMGTYFSRGWWLREFFVPTPSEVPEVTVPTTAPTEAREAAEQQIAVAATNLTIPWEVVELTDGSLLVTERPGRLVRVYPQRQATVGVSGVAHVGEGGLMGMALHPNYETNRWLYLMMTTRESGGLTNRVVRYEFDEEMNQLSQPEVVVSGIPGAANHDGGRIKFGPDGYLYITTGDAQQEQLAQDTNSLAGKILRVSDTGSIPEDNPFSNAVYSYGHRNVQGIAWDEQGRLWATEHGPSGIQSGCDEVNLIQRGGNYGWPQVRCEQTRTGMIDPVIQSGRSDTWAPAGMAIIGQTLLFAGLRGEAVYRGTIEEEKLINLTRLVAGEYGRLRTVSESQDGDRAYVLTSNRDGRGEPINDDDRVVVFIGELLF